MRVCAPRAYWWLLTPSADSQENSGTGGAREPWRLPVLLLGQVASPECVCDEMPRPDRRGYGEANKDDKIKIIDVLDAEPVE